MLELTTKQKNLISTCVAAGYGWAKFALSVEAQGWCSPKQEETLERLVWKISSHPKHSNYTTRDSDHDISDEEAGMSGDFF